MKENKLFLIFSVVLLSACSSIPDKPVVNTVIQRVEIPVPVYCKVEIPEVPKFRFGELTEDSTLFEKSQILLIDRNLHLSYEELLLAALKSCVK